MSRIISLCRVVTGAITAYVAGTLQSASVDAQGNLRCALVGGGGSTAVVVDSAGRVMVRQPDCWSITHVPATNVKATITRAAGGAGVSHICDSISFSLIDTSGLITTPVAVNLRDGATGAGTILWSLNVVSLGVPITVAVSGLRIAGTANTAMTLEFAAAGGVATFEAVSLTGYDAS